jgi:iron complex outermembrane receptor protein
MQIRRKLSFLVVTALAGATLLQSPAVKADKTLSGLPTEDVYFTDIPVVLSVTRLAQPKSDAPAAITVIDRSTIEASGIREIPELMRLVPGFQVGHDYGDVLAPEQTPVTYLGYSDQFSRKMQVLVDGRSVYDPMYGGVRWSELGLLLDDIDRIEVIRGPNAASYGSNAFLGVINIITRDPASGTGTTTGVDLSTAGKRLATLRHFGGSGDNRYRISASYLEDGPHVGRHDAIQSQTFSYRGVIKLKNEDSIDLHLGLSQGLRQLGNDDPLVVAADTYPWHDGYVNNNYQQIKWTRRPSGNSEYSLQLYHNYGQFDNTYQAYISGVLTASNASTKTNRWDLEFQHTINPKNEWRWVWGMGARLDEAWGVDWYTSNEWQQNYLYRLFGNGEWRPGDKWTFNFGAMAEHSTVAGTTLSPRVAANYHVNDSDTIRTAVSQGYRNPSIFENFANTTVYMDNVNNPPGIPVTYFYSDGTVHAAKVNNYEVGYLHQARDDRFTLDSRLFLMQFRDTIAYYNDVTAPYTYGNGGEADIYGTEVQGKYRFNSRTSVTTSYAYARHQGWYVSDATTIPATTGSSDQTTPTHTFSLLLDHKFTNQWSAGVFYHYVSNMQWFNGTPLSNGYNIVNVRLGKKFKVGAKQASFEIIGQNLSGEYIDMLNEIKLQRTWYVGLRLPL